jgi:glucosamine-6-phosphate deaminase
LEAQSVGLADAVRRLKVDDLPIEVYASRKAMGAAAATVAQQLLQESIAQRGEANLILATGNSQLTFLHALAGLAGSAWDKVRVFHMDEYLGIPPDHPASFPLFLRQHILDRVQPGAFYPVPGQPANVDVACAEYAALLQQYPADLVALGFGENGHLAFNDPPYAKFDDPAWVKVVALDETSRKQQVGEGHFAILDDVPTHAITLTIPALLAAKRILAIVPEARKAKAVRACLYEPVSEDRPGSILRHVKHATLYLDPDSASGLAS